MAACAPRRPRCARLPRDLAHLAPLLRERSRIEALAAALIDLLDSFDAPLTDMEDKPDCCPTENDPTPFPIHQRRCSPGAGSLEDAEPDEDGKSDEAGRLVV